MVLTPEEIAIGLTAIKVGLNAWQAMSDASQVTPADMDAADKKYAEQLDKLKEAASKSSE